MKYILGFLGVMLLLALILIGGSVSVWNGLVAKDEGVKAEWSQIDAQLQRRADLIPNLVSTVKGYSAHEKEIFESIANARAGLLSAKSPIQKAEANDVLNASLGRLLAIAENYPNLKADQSFIRLQDELAGTENRIAVARVRYNDAAKTLNASIRSFPGALFAGLAGVKPADYFQPKDKAAVEKPPEVKF